MDTKLRKLFESYHDRPGKCGFVTQVEDKDGIKRRCMVRYDRFVTDIKVVISNITVYLNGTDITCYERVQAKIKLIEARCMTHAEQDREYAENLLQTFKR